MITRILILQLIVLSLSQIKELNDNFCNTNYSANKNLSIEIYGGQYYTYEHMLEPLDTRTPRASVWFEMLPSSMWRIGGRVRYPMASHVALSLDIGYGSSQDIDFIYSHDIIPPRFKFTITHTSCAISYSNRLSVGLDYHLGAGLGAIYPRLHGDDVQPSDNDTTVSAFYLSPTVNGSFGFYLFTHFYIRAQVESKLYHVLKTGADEVHLPDFLPSITLGLGYTFSFNIKQNH